jgi:hypothetical protein
LVTDEEWARVRADGDFLGVDSFPAAPGDEVVLREP